MRGNAIIGAVAEVVVNVEIAAPPDVVYDLVSDLPRMGEWSPECERVSWKPPSRAARVGAQFRGHNRIGWRRWSTSGRVVAAQRGRELSFDISSLFGLPVARWSYRLEESAGGCSVQEVFEDHRGRLLKAVGIVGTGVTDRAAHNRRTMATTLAQLKKAAEARAAAG